MQTELAPRFTCGTQGETDPVLLHINANAATKGPHYLNCPQTRPAMLNTFIIGQKQN